MNTINLTEQEVKDIVNLGDYQTIDEKGGKHDCTNEKILFKKDNKHYVMWITLSYNDGLQLWGDTEVTEVKQVEKIVKVWEPV